MDYETQIAETIAGIFRVYPPDFTKYDEYVDIEWDYLSICIDVHIYDLNLIDIRRILNIVKISDAKIELFRNDNNNPRYMTLRISCGL